MTKAIISVDGKDYPCYITMGAFLEFKKETGKEASETMTAAGISDMLAWLWAVVKSASRREKKKFPLSLEEFADAITPEELPAIISAIQGDETSDEEDSKKKLPES